MIPIAFAALAPTVLSRRWRYNAKRWTRRRNSPSNEDCPSAVTVRVTDKRLLTRRPDPCRGIVGPRVVPLSRNAPNAGLSRRDPYGVLSRLASRITDQRDLTLEHPDQGAPAG